MTNTALRRKGGNRFHYFLSFKDNACESRCREILGPLYSRWMLDDMTIVKKRASNEKEYCQTKLCDRGKYDVGLRAFMIHDVSFGFLRTYAPPRWGSSAWHSLEVSFLSSFFRLVSTVLGVFFFFDKTFSLLPHRFIFFLLTSLNIAHDSFQWIMCVCGRGRLEEGDVRR